jgi:hypothetical protein
MRRLTLGLLAAAVITVAGCGSGSSNPPPAAPTGTTAHTTPTSVYKITPGNNPP